MKKLPYIVLFPGQGSQHVGMGRALFNDCEAAKGVLQECESYAKFPLLRYMFEGPADTLVKPSIAQPAIMALSLALLSSYNNYHKTDIVRDASFLMGHSLGEYTALVAAKSFSVEDGIQLVHQRGLEMEELITTDYRMTAIILQRQTSFSELEEFLSEQGLLNNPNIAADIANINSSSQIVLSGTAQDINHVVSLLQSEKLAGRAIDLPVGGPFHSRLMKNASAKLTQVLESKKCNPPCVPIISNVTAKVFGNDIKQLLVKQLYSPVRWYPSILEAKKSNISHFLEFGPRPVLGNLIKKDFPSDSIQSFTDYNDIIKVRITQ